MQGGRAILELIVPFPFKNMGIVVGIRVQHLGRHSLAPNITPLQENLFTAKEEFYSFPGAMAEVYGPLELHQVGTTSLA